eukprot:gene39546-53473_t
MSIHSVIKRATAPDIRARKGGGRLVMLTAYHALSARLADPHCDILLVGDSLGNVLYGFETTLQAWMQTVGSTEDDWEVPYFGHNVRFALGGAMMAGDSEAALTIAGMYATLKADDLKSSAWMQASAASRWFAEGRYTDPDKVLAMTGPGDDAPLVRAMWRYGRGEALARKGDAKGVLAEAAAMTITGKEMAAYKGSSPYVKAMLTASRRARRSARRRSASTRRPARDRDSRGGEPAVDPHADEVAETMCPGEEGSGLGQRRQREHVRCIVVAEVDDIDQRRRGRGRCFCDHLMTECAAVQGHARRHRPVVCLDQTDHFTWRADISQRSQCALAAIERGGEQPQFGCETH